MTDGDFNTPYCTGVISKDATTGSGAAGDHIDCNATNGNSFYQAEELCTAMKAKGITVYTVGFDRRHDQTAKDMMTVRHRSRQSTTSPTTARS